MVEELLKCCRAVVPTAKDGNRPGVVTMVPPALQGDARGGPCRGVRALGTEV